MNKTLTTQEIFELIKNNTEIEYLSKKYPDINIVRDIKEDGIRLWINNNGEVFNSYLFFTEHNNTIDVSFNTTKTHPREQATLEHINADRDETQEILTTISCVVSFYVYHYFSDISKIRDLYADYNEKYNIITKPGIGHNDFTVYFDSDYRFGATTIIDNSIDLSKYMITTWPYRSFWNTLLWIITFGYVHRKWFYKLKKVV